MQVDLQERLRMRLPKLRRFLSSMSAYVCDSLAGQLLGVRRSRRGVG